MTSTPSPSVIPKARATAPTIQILNMVRRQFRAGLSGFYVFIVCIALGVMAITAVGALSDSLRHGLKLQGRQILGGDILLKRVHTRATDDERAVLDSLAQPSETAGMRSNAARPDGTDQTLIELRGVDARYPMVGTLSLLTRGANPVLKSQMPGQSLRRAIHEQTGAAVEPLLLERLNLKLGDKLKVGTLEVEITALIGKIPDALSGRISYGPNVLVSLDTLKKTGLLQPGALVRWRYALKLPPAKSGDTALEATNKELKRQLSGHGFTISDKTNPSPQISRMLERLRQFLTLVGLTSLLVGGVGVANAVATFIDKNRKTIATLKSVGATGSQIFTIFLSQVFIVALLGVMIGLAMGLMVPIIVGWIIGDALPIDLGPALSASSIVTALVYGILVSLLFSIWPLGRLRQVQAAVLFRDEVAQLSNWPPPAIIAITVALIAALLAFAILSSDARKLAIYFCLSTLVVFALFHALGIALTWLARKIPHPSWVNFAIAMRSLGAPGGLTKSVVLSLGTGLSVLVAVALTDASFQEDLKSRLPETSPDYYILDIPQTDLASFKELITRHSPSTIVRDAPMLRGRLVRLAGRRVEDIKAPDAAQWVLHGDRGITYADELPPGSQLTHGTWWARNYNGDPLVSFETELARQLGLKIGDTITVNILGRDVTARIANLRKVDWDSLAINFVMVFTPITLQGAPTNRLATLKFSKDTTLADEAALTKALSRAFPTATQVRVKDAIGTFNAIFTKVMVAIRAASALTLIIGAIVLAGALATARRRRARDAVILLTLGATRARILKVHLTEYLIISVATAGFAIALGTAAAALVLTQVMDTPVAFSPISILHTMALAIGMVVIFGSIGTYSVLRARPLSHLRGQ